MNQQRLGQLWASAMQNGGFSMAYIEKRKHSNGKFTYRARVRQAGSPDISASFNTRGEAVKWSQLRESEIRGGRYFGKEEDRERTFAEFIDRYI